MRNYLRDHGVKLRVVPAGLVALAAAASWLLAATPVRALGEDVTLSRWAIISSPEVQQSGLTDLLTAELSGIREIELVEREQLDAAMKELEVTALLGAKSAAGRLQLGRVLRANVLVLLSREAGGAVLPVKSNRSLKLVICDCSSGARLRAEYLEEEDDTARCAETIVAVVRQVRSQFRDGLRAVIGVSPFISRNLSHDFDRLQSGYAEIVQAALSSHPGVAVIEIEEARSVAQELARGGDEIHQRPVAVFVEGEFKMSTVSLAADTEVWLTLVVTVGDSSPRRSLVQPITPEQTIEFLSASLPNQILRLAAGQPGEKVSRDAQYRLLTARADMFAGVGDYRHSTDLRHAALLLKPHDTEQTLRSIVETILLLMPPTREKLDKLTGTGHTRTAADLPDCQARWRWMVREIESVIRLRQVNPREAHVLVCLARQTADHVAGVSREPWRKESWPALERIGDSWRRPKPPEVRGRLDQFFRHVYPLFPNLDPAIESGTIRPLVVPALLAGYHDRDDSDEVIAECRKEMPPGAQYALWSGTMLWNVHTAARTLFCSYGTSENRRLSDGHLRNGKHYDTRHYYDTVFWLLTNVELQPFSIHPFKNNKVMAPDWRLRIQGVPAISYSAPGGVPIPYPSQEDLEQREQLIVRLAKAGRRDLEFIARGLRLLDSFAELRGDVRRFSKEHGAQTPLSARLAAEFQVIEDQIASLRAWVKGHGYISTQPPPNWDPLAGLQCFRGEVARYREFVRPKAGPDRKPVHPRPAARVAIERPALEQPDVVFEPIEGADVECDRLVNCGTWDVAYRSRTYDTQKLMVIRQMGHLELLFALQARDRILAVEFDGRNVWLATENNGIRVLDAAGRTVALWSSVNGLPEYDERLILYPCQPGRCLVIGLYQAEGTSPRTWFAVFEYGETGRQPIRMVHTATTVADNTDAADQGFVPIWVAPWSQPDAPEKSLLLVGRCNGDPNRIPDQWQRRPLIVDLETFDFSVSPGRFPAVNSSARSHHFAMVPGPRVFIGGGGRVHIVEPPPKGGDRWTWKSIPPREQPADPPTSPPLRFDNAPISPNGTVAWEGRLFCRRIGGWWSYDPESGSLKTLPHSPPLAIPVGVSSHYGLVTWRDGKLQRARIVASK